MPIDWLDCFGRSEKLTQLLSAAQDALEWFEEEPDTANLPITQLLRLAIKNFDEE